jgi:predicted RNA binding protein YcfA (HicA-like mRNA interferase family)
MSKVEKLLARMRANPRDWNIDDLKTLAKRFYVDWRQPGTSHVTFSAKGHIPVTVPAHKPVKPIYIKKFLELLNAIEKQHEENQS